MAQLRFSLRSLLVVVAAISVGLAIAVVLVPELWMLATETRSGRISAGRFLAACLFFIAILTIALPVRIVGAWRKE